MTARLSDQTVFVTGAGSGIGRATAILAASEGAAVVCADVDEKTLRETVAALEADGARAHAVPCNVMDPASVTAAMAAGAEAFDGLDVLFNVAGIGGLAHTEDVSFEEWQRILGVNLTGTFLVSQAALPHLLAKRRSAIVNVASVAGLNGQAYSAAYCASKWGVVGLTKALAVEYVKRGLRVNCVCPAGVKTPLMGKFGFPENADVDLIKRFGLVPKFTHPEEVAEALVYLGSSAARSINGVALPLDFGNSAT
ncbi:MAG: SDR family oxidoreductase [Myxococcales bacterium]|nr:SDR family oxidoreductase [Myxococcales bacterium]